MSQFTHARPRCCLTRCTDALSQLTEKLAGRYVVERELGAGGMATVYLARDVKHERRVALKVLNPELGAVLGADRFLAEIKVTANLQHPNLLPLFDSGSVDGLLFYVMPYVEGETLRQRLAREKQLPVETATHIAAAILGALDYAHRRGVIHRDLKPENILMHEGQPLVADFGIALAVSNAGGARITQTGLSLGTPQYMSPEQATGDRAIDGRTDIYSLGAVLYEMLTGEPPHLGNTAQAIIARVITDRPQNVRTMRPAVPGRIATAIERALEKLPADRFATAQEFVTALRRVDTEPAEPLVVAERSGRRAWGGAVVGAVAAAAAGGALATWASLRPSAPADPAPTRFVVTLPRNIAVDNIYAPLAISPDGRTIIIRAAMNNAKRLVRRQIDEIDVQTIAGTDGAGWPVVSPDNKWIAFRSADGLRKVPIDGGPSELIAAGPAVGRGFDWAPNGMLVVGTTESHSGLATVPATGGTLKPLTRVDSAGGEVSHGWPRVLSDGNTVVYGSTPREGAGATRLAVTTLTSGASKRLDVLGTSPLGVFDGQLVYVSRDGTLMAVPFDIKAQKITGQAVALLEGISMNRSVNAARAAISNSGTLVYVAGGGSTSLLTADLSGATKTLIEQTVDLASPAWSPDGRRILVNAGAGVGDIWLYDLVTQAFSPFTSDGASANATWTPDGKRVVYVSRRNARTSLWWQPADGSATAEKLIDAIEVVEAVAAPDGRTLVYRTLGRNELFTVDIAGDRVAKPLFPGRSGMMHPSFSRDGKYIAYATDDAGSRQVVVRPFPGPGGAVQVSTDGGTDPVWSPDGKTLYYRNDRQMIAVPLSFAPAIGIGTRRVLFEGDYVTNGVLTRPGASISPDGKHFVLVRRPDSEARIVVVKDWLTELRARVAGKGRP